MFAFTNNLAAEKPDLVKELTGRMDSLLQAMNGQLPVPNNQ